MNLFEKELAGYFGPHKLRKIQSVRVGIAGLGGLGSNCAFNLARSGFKKFVLCDFDVVAVKNLNRQFYFMEQVGMQKTRALQSNLLRINPHLEIIVKNNRIDEKNIKTIFSGCQIVVEAFDSAACKKMAAQAFMNSSKLLVSASGLAGWGRSDDVVTRKLRDNFYLIGDLESEASKILPPCSPRVNVAAAKQADVILNWAIQKKYKKT
ncbi:MAG: sulfur carrier protein ThiS adenylyltransferase ThiF [Candidatus Omnitrophota bacterium]|jgi:sulfur carrier protein ThiS adenylyltransferase|nr:MAG: sulfur carrier protein ThiS adenylyltransferase ThiF [Candidatus Omnitrophota bacterium]